MEAKDKIRISKIIEDAKKQLELMGLQSLPSRWLITIDEEVSGRCTVRYRDENWKNVVLLRSASEMDANFVASSLESTLEMCQRQNRMFFYS